MLGWRKERSVHRRTEQGRVCWRQVMTNMRPKTYFLRPDVALPMGFALLRELWAQRVAKRPDAYQASASAA